MYTKKEFEEQVRLFRSYYNTPIQTLIDHSKLTRPTVMKFFKQDPSLRSYKRDALIDLVIHLNGQAQEKRKELQVKGARMLQIELDLDHNDRILAKHTSQ